MFAEGILAVALFTDVKRLLLRAEGNSFPHVSFSLESQRIFGKENFILSTGLKIENYVLIDAQKLLGWSMLRLYE